VAKIDAGTYSLQLTFENPGGGVGIPGNGHLGDEEEGGCEEIEFEVAVSPLSDYSQIESGQGTSGWCAPSADRVPTKEDLGVIREGTRFGLRDDDDDDDDDVSPGTLTLHRILPPKQVQRGIASRSRAQCVIGTGPHLVTKVDARSGLLHA
jgi:hypothetical protein